MEFVWKQLFQPYFKYHSEYLKWKYAAGKLELRIYFEMENVSILVRSHFPTSLRQEAAAICRTADRVYKHRLCIHLSVSLHLYRRQKLPCRLPRLSPTAGRYAWRIFIVQWVIGTGLLLDLWSVDFRFLDLKAWGWVVEKQEVCGGTEF